MIVGMSMVPPPPPRPPRRQPRPAPGFVEPTAPVTSPTRRRGPENPAPGIKFSDVANFLNPFPSLTSAVAERRAPKGSDLALDAGLFAAGFIPFAGPGLRAGGQAARAGSRAAQPALETGEAIAARRDAINRLLDDEGPQAINQFLNNPLTGYLGTLNRGTLNRFFKETPERIPKGTQMFRAPSKGEVQSRLPREVGADYMPGTVRSAGGPSDLQRLGEVLGGKTVGDLTGGNQSYAPGLASITARDDLPGILDINEFLARYAGQYGGQGRPAIAPSSSFNMESVLGPQISYRVRDFNPGSGNVPPTWYLDAFNR